MVITSSTTIVISSSDALVAVVPHAPGDKVTLTYLDAAGKPQTVEVTLGKPRSDESGRRRQCRSGYTVDCMEQPVELVGRALVVVVDDRIGARRKDHNGPLVTAPSSRPASWWTAWWWCPPTRSRSRNALNTRGHRRCRSGGVRGRYGVATPRDVTPGGHPRDPRPTGRFEASPGLCGCLSARIIDAGLSRGLAGVSGSTLVVNVAGSRYAVRDGMATLNPLAVQIIGQLSNSPRNLTYLPACLPRDA